MERRALIAAVISILILVVYQEVVVRYLYPPEASTPGVAAPPGAEAPIAAPPAALPPAVPAAPAAEAKAAALPAGSDVVVDTNLYRAVFTTAGARLKSLELKRYTASVAPGSPPLQMVQFPVSGQLPLGLALVGERQLGDAEVVYLVEPARLDIPADGSGELLFTGKLDGATVRKRITMRGDSYQWSVDVDVTSAPAGYTEIALGWAEGLTPAAEHSGEVVFDSVVVLQENKLKPEPFTSLEAGSLLEKNIGWVAFGGLYFVAAMVPEVEANNGLRVWAKSGGHSVEAQLLFPPNNFAAHVEIYAGPKDLGKLEAVGHGLRKVVDLGFFTFVALPMLEALRLLHRVTGNYGVAIILLTVLVKLLFHPLTKKSFQSMKAMQKLQPEMTKLRERLKDKPEEMNREVMELYRRNKVNPLGGCLPMLLQLPVFIGLYSALQNGIELRHAPFVGWITDLSAPDRLGSIQLPFVTHPGVPVLTLAMGASMFVQQWMTPSAADPAQQRVMMIMPLMFTFMFINFPAGLTLYWLVNNLLTIAQQYAITHAGERSRPGRAR